MARLAFTIALNALHHFKHNDYAERLANMTDIWVIAEGAVNNTGSTSWCKRMPAVYHNNGRSVDGTIDYIKELERKYPNKIALVQQEGMWPNKDIQVSAAIDYLKKRMTGKPNFLWQIDADEQWTADQLNDAEQELLRSGKDYGMFLCDYYVNADKTLLAKGHWGEGRGLPYNRLWKWSGQRALSHEPPVFDQLTQPILLHQRFQHYAYVFEQDVKFKAEWYSGHEKVLEGWKKVSQLTSFPQDCSILFGGVGYNIGKTQIVNA